MTDKKMQAGKRIHYVPPARETVNKFSRDVCEAMANKTGDESFLRNEVVFGFADFIHFIGGLQAKILNKQQEEAAEGVEKESKI